MTPQRPCPVCGAGGATLWACADDIEYFTGSTPHPYWHCSNCRSLYLDPLPAGGLDTIYPSNYYSYDAGGGLLWKLKAWIDARRLRRSLSAIPGTRLRALDVGGGSGTTLDLARRADSRVCESWVIDIDAGAEARAKAKGHQFFLGPFEQFSDARPFDVIFAFNVIEHVADPAEFLRHCARLLTPDGQLFVQTPNFESLDARLFRRRSWAGLHCPRHWVLFSDASLRRAADAADLRVARLEFTQGAPFWAKSVLATLHGWNLVRLGRDRPADAHPLLPLLMAGFAAIDFLRRPFAKTSQMLLTLSRRR